MNDPFLSQEEIETKVAAALKEEIGMILPKSILEIISDAVFDYLVEKDVIEEEA